MLASIAVALALASPLMLDVPYLPQSDALCGGAAAAMVFRYWGDTHASVQEFAALVDRRGGGIADDVLASDIRQRGWNAERFEGSIALLRDRLERREPVVVLLADRGTRYHYVVVVGLTDDGVIVHDPSWGPSRTIREAEFVRLWEPSRFWALLVRPGDDAIVTSGPSAQLAAALSSSSIPQRNACDALPDRSTARLGLRPDADGFAVVDVVIVERASVPRRAGDFAAISAGAAIDREVTLSVPGFTGEGEIWKASWRFWSNRPRVAVGFVAPRLSRLPGIWSVDASWDVQTFAVADSTSLLRESRTHGGVAVTDWMTAMLRYTLRGGLDRWNGGRRAASVGGTLERRLFRDRVSVVLDAERWVSIGDAPDFGTTGVRADVTLPLATGGW